MGAITRALIGKKRRKYINKNIIRKIHLDFEVNDYKKVLGNVSNTFTFRNAEELENKVKRFEKIVRANWDYTNHYGIIWISLIDPLTIDGRDFDY